MKNIREKRACLFIIAALLQLVNLNVYGQNKAVDKDISIQTLLDIAKCGKWQTIKEREGVEISYRWLSYGDTLKTREIALNFRVEATAHKVLENLRTKSALTKWNHGVKELNVYTKTDSLWITHTVYDIPYPLSEQDLVTRNHIVTNDEVIIIDVTAAPDLVIQNDNINRQRYYFGRWSLASQADGATKVRFSAISFSKSNIPRFIRDPIVQNKLLSSFITLKEISVGNNRVASLYSSECERGSFSKRR